MALSSFSLHNSEHCLWLYYLTRHSKYSSLCAKQAKAEVVALQFAPSVSVLRTVTFLALEVPSAFLHVSARKVIVMAEFGTF